MSDSVQSSSLVTLPDYQKASGDRDPLPFASTLFISRDSARGQETARARDKQDFESYLNKQSILALGRYQSNRFDAVAEILRNSVYKPIAAI